MKSLNKYVGLDVHKDTTVIAVAEGDRAGEVRLYGTISSDLHGRTTAQSGGRFDRALVTCPGGRKTAFRILRCQPGLAILSGRSKVGRPERFSRRGPVCPFVAGMFTAEERIRIAVQSRPPHPVKLGGAS